MSLIPVIFKFQLIVASCLRFVFLSCRAQLRSSFDKLNTAAANKKSITELYKDLNIGDVVFIHITPFGKISETTQSWVNHVGIVVDVAGSVPIIAESAVPFSRTTTLPRFLARSRHGRIAIARLTTPLTDAQKNEIWLASKKRLGIFYDTGFNLNSKREFCSRYVREVLAEATGITVGKVETFRELLTSNPDSPLAFWRIWYFGNIPWDRQTVTPASLFRCNQLRTIFDGLAN